MGYKTDGVDTDQYIYKGSFIKFHHHLNIGPGVHALNKKVLSVAKEKNPGFIWIDNKSYLKKETLKKLRKFYPGLKIIIIVTDDLTGRLKHQWRLTLKNAEYFNCFFVQRKVNMDELKSYGAKHVELCYRSYDPGFHRPVLLDKEEVQQFKSPVGFIGTYEASREEYITFLIENNIPVMVTGDGWPKGKYWKMVKPYYRGPSIYGEDYIKSINGMDIALHFLRHENRDEQDSRTFEIPACGVFMLAEKSELHTRLFEPGKEAVFFETKQELLEKVNYYLKHGEERKSIAAGGLLRAKQSDYTHEGRLKGVIAAINGETE